MVEEKPNYYAIIPADVRYDKDLKAIEKLLFGEISSLTNKNGCCFASNNYFAKLYEVSNETVSRWISNLKKKGYLDSTIIYKKGTKEIEKRVLTKTSIPIDEIINTPIDENVKDNNTSINNKKNNISNDILQEKRFKKPTLEEIKVYCKERKNNIDAQYFIDHYESNGWRVGKTPMKDWKATIRTWERNNNKKKINRIETEAEKLVREIKEAEEELRQRNE